jgi:DNA-binding MarR family transcriptional regulator
MSEAVVAEGAPGAARHTRAVSHRLPYDPIEEAGRIWRERGWSEAAPGMAAVTSLMRAHQLMLARVENVLRPRGLTFSRYELLMLLEFSRAGSLPLSKIGLRLQVHPASVTNAVDRLELAGLVRRLPHPTDRRTTLAEISPRGREVAAEATAELNDAVFRAPGLPTPKVDQLVQLLQELRHDAGDF